MGDETPSVLGLVKMAMKELNYLCETAADLAGETDELTKRWHKVEEIMEQLDSGKLTLVLKA